MLHDTLPHMRLVIIADRLPITLKLTRDTIQVNSSPGGVASGLQSFIESLGKDKKIDYVWIGRLGVNGLNKTVQSDLNKKFSAQNLKGVFLNQNEAEKYYDGFCNDTIWPLFHTFPSFANVNEEDWQAYVSVNKKFCEAALEIIKPGDMVWVHDYQLMLLPQMLREATSKSVSIGFFLHIPFPEFEVFRLLPKQWRRDILDGLLGADLVAFHTYDYRKHFLDVVERVMEYETTNRYVGLSNRKVRVDSLPLGIDYEKFNKAYRRKKVRDVAKAFKKIASGRKIILSIDRLDYTKGIVNRLRAYDLLLETSPKWRGKVQMFLIVVPSREGVERYQQMKHAIDEMVGFINGKYGTLSWSPINYNYGTHEFDELVALYSVADVALVTPLRDGMNLVAKEYIASRSDQTGVLVLSELTGSAQELSEAVLVNPNHVQDIVEGLNYALSMSKVNQIKLNSHLQKRLRDYTVTDWASDFMDELGRTKKISKIYRQTMLLSEKRQKTLIASFQKSKHPVLLLDYDGTLVEFESRPELAKPDKDLLRILKKITKKAEVIIISGRDKESLSEWFRGLDIDLVAEHGAYLYKHAIGWRPLIKSNGEWKSKILPILEAYSRRTPGSFVEKKDFSLVWHYRMANPELAIARAKEMETDLLSMASDKGLELMHGSKAIEIGQMSTDKGKTARLLLESTQHDFVLAAGDDVTDENLFSALKPSVNSIKIGNSPTSAKFRLHSTKEFLQILRIISK
jgi:trehalose 6-phosphate synthase/phosphatase